MPKPIPAAKSPRPFSMTQKLVPTRARASSKHLAPFIAPCFCTLWQTPFLNAVYISTQHRVAFLLIFFANGFIRLCNPRFCANIFRQPKPHGALAQLARVLVWQTRGQGFESPKLHHTAARLHWQHPASFCGVFAFLPCRKFFRRGHRIRLRRRLCGLSDGARNACAPFGTRRNTLRRWRRSVFFLMSALVQVEHATRAPPFGTRKSSCAAHSLFFFCPPILRFVRRGEGYPVEHAMRAPPFGTRKSSRAAHCLFFFCPPILRFMRRGVGYPVERTGRVPPFGTRKSSCAAHCLFFFCPPILRFMRRGVGYPVEHAMRAPPLGTRKSSCAAHCLFSFAHPFCALCAEVLVIGWSTLRVRPRSALAKAAVLRTVFFSFAHPFCALCAEVWAKEKQPLAGLLLLVGAGGRTRTDTDFTPQDFESSASASFTTPAQITIYHSAGELTSVFATARNVLQDVSCRRREGRKLRGERGAGRVAENFEKMCGLAYANLLTKGERAAYNSGVKSE